MEEPEKASFHGFKSPPSFADLNKEFYLPVLSEIWGRYRSPPLMERELPTQPVQSGRLHLDSSPVPLLQELPCTSSRDESKIEDHLNNSNSKIECPECHKEFDTDKAMFGHMRIHRDRGHKVFKKCSVSKPRPQPDSYIDRLLTKSWSVTGKRGRKPVLDKNSPEALAAATLVEIANLIYSCQNKKMGTDESDPLVEKKHVCEICNKSFPSYQALGGHCSSHRKERDNAVFLVEQTVLQSGEMQESVKRKVKSGAHECEICGMSYDTGQQLGGHKRAHYKKDLSVIGKVPDGFISYLDLADMLLSSNKL